MPLNCLPMPEKQCHHPNTGTHMYRRLGLIFHIKKNQPNPSQKAKHNKEKRFHFWKFTVSEGAGHFFSSSV